MRRRTSRGTLALLTALIVLLAAPALAAADPALPPGFQDEVAIANIQQPVAFRFAPDGRVFVATKPGRIYVYENVEDTTPELFADLRTDVYDTGDRGLLGLALDPKFDEGRPYVYALYTYDHILGEEAPPPKWGSPEKTGDPCPDLNGGDACLVSGRLVRLTAEGEHAAPSAKEPAQKQLAEGWCQQFSSHSIGDLQFGPEGDLYVSGGDGASFTSADYGQLGTEPNPCGDPPSPAGTADEPPSAEGGSLRAQNLTNLSGKILRVDPDTGAGLPGNPLGGSADENTRRIVAMGFRNPFRFTLDPTSGELYTDNVGSSEIEELDRFAAPPSAIYNSGWPCYEGPSHQFQFKVLGLSVCENLYKAEAAGEPKTAEPFFYYSHGSPVVEGDECPFENGSALGGISFYEGEQFPAAYKGALFFTDAVRGCVYAMFPGEDGRPDPETAIRFMRENQIYPAVDIQEGPGGYLYYADLFGNEEGGNGSIHKISYAPGAPTAKLTANPPYGTSFPLAVSFDASESSDPTGEKLEYEWDLNGDGVFETKAGATETVEYTKAELEEHEKNHEALNRLVAVRVKDPEGLTSVARVTVYPGDAPPTVEIQKPAPSTQWAVGDVIEMEALGKNWKGEKDFAPLGYDWSTRLFHCPDPAEPTKCHTHPLGTFNGVRHESFIAPEHDYPSHIDVTVTYTDERGLAATKTVSIFPRTVNLAITSSPPGIELTAGLLQGPSPLSLTAIEKAHVLLSAPETAQVGGKAYTFENWSDGGSRIHTILASSSTEYRATYTTPGEVEPPKPPEEAAQVPNTVLRKHPPKKTRATTARFAFGADIAVTGFTCKLDGKPKSACRSPKTYKHLKPGKHIFKVWATAGMLTDPTPAKFSWKILARH
ncbi:MAG: PQQ-dependent sugar dehydrogenase [Solirubrobacterales bacterium]